jgi:site-specific DNA recombinase
MAYGRSRARSVAGPATDHAVAWTRVSTKEQAEGNHSLPNQRRRILSFASTDDYALRRFGGGWHVDRWFVARGESAFAGKRREWLAMLEFVKAHAGRFGAVLVDDLSRFSRRARHQLNAVAELRAVGVVVRSVSEPSFDETPSGTLIGTISAAMAEERSANLSVRIMDARRLSLEDGRIPHQPPCGYTVNPARPGIPLIDPAQGPLMRQLFAWVDGGEPVAHAVSQLRKRGLRVSRTRAHELLRSPVYCGLTILGNGREIRGQWEPMVSSEQWRRVQARLTGPKPAATRPYGRNADDFPLKGFVVCGGCGRRLTGDVATRGKRPARRAYYDCPQRRGRRGDECVRCRPDVLHDAFLDLLRRTVVATQFTPEEVAKRWRVEQGGLREERRQCQHRRSDLERSVEETTEALTRTRSDAAIKALEGRIEGLSDQLGQCESRIDALDEALACTEAEVAELVTAVNSLALDREWCSRPLAGRRALQAFVFPLGVEVFAASGAGVEIRTPATASVFGVLARGMDESVGVASPTGFEPVFWP